MKTLIKYQSISNTPHDKSITHTNDKKSWWIAGLFAGIFLTVGMVDAILSISFLWNGTIVRTDLKYPPIYPPTWAFWAVWLILYPTWGVATSLVWQKRHEVNLRSFYIFFGLYALANLAFLPLGGLASSNPVILSLMDASGIVFAPLSIWFYTRYSKTALYWLLPLVIWTPITLFFKVWLSFLNGGSLPI